MAGLPVAMKRGYSDGRHCRGGPPRRDVFPPRLHPDEDDAPECRGREPRPPERRVGIDIDGAIEPDIDAIVERKDDIVESIRKGPTRTSRATRTSTSSKVTASSNPHMKFASTIEPSRPKPSSSTRAPDRRGRRSTASTTSTFTTARICWSVPRFPPHWPSSAVATSAVSTPRCTAGSGRRHRLPARRHPPPR